MSGDPFDLDPARIRESMIRLDLLQFARGEMHVAKEDLREILDRDLKEYKRELRSRDLRILSLALTVAALIIGGDVWTVSQTVGRVEKRAEAAVNKEIEAIRERARTELAAEVQNIRHEVSERLNREFEAPRIRALVEEKAKDYAEKQARAYLTERVDQSIKPYSERITRASAEIDDLRNLFYIAERAMDGALPSYLQLLDIAREKSERGEIATRRLAAIQRRV